MHEALSRGINAAALDRLETAHDLVTIICLWRQVTPSDANLADFN